MSIRVHLTLLPGLLLAALALGAVPSTAEAQFGKRLKDAVKRTAEAKAVQKTTETESNAIDDALEGGGEAKPDSAPAGGAPPKRAGEGAFVSFDFVPGDRVLFYDDYTSDNVGDFPRRLEFEDGNAEIADWEGGKWLRVSKSAKFTITLPEVLPQRFTVEFDFVTNHRASNGWPVMLNMSGAESNWESQGSYNPTVRWSYNKGGAYVGKIEAEGPAGGELQDKVNRARIMADGKYTKAYFNGVRVANAPNADLGRSNKVQFWVPGYDPEGVQATMIGPIRIAAGGQEAVRRVVGEGAGRHPGDLLRHRE